MCTTQRMYYYTSFSLLSHSSFGGHGVFHGKAGINCKHLQGREMWLLRTQIQVLLVVSIVMSHSSLKQVKVSTENILGSSIIHVI